MRAVSAGKQVLIDKRCLLPGTPNLNDVTMHHCLNQW
jgi:hypothetical protein